jgi:hypothetical protein
LSGDVSSNIPSFSLWLWQNPSQTNQKTRANAGDQGKEVTASILGSGYSARLADVTVIWFGVKSYPTHTARETYVTPLGGHFTILVFFA